MKGNFVGVEMQRGGMRPSVRSRVRPGDALGYEIVNLGRIPLMFGESYALERKCSAGWAHANARMFFRLWGRTLRAGDRYILEARIPADANAGDYRLRKKLRPEWETVRDPALRAAVPVNVRDALELIAEFRS